MPDERECSKRTLLSVSAVGIAGTAPCRSIDSMPGQHEGSKLMLLSPGIPSAHYFF